MSAGACPPRHHLVWLAPDWAGALRAPVAPSLLAEAERWIARGRPAVAARRAPGSDAVALGIALPGPRREHDGERRVALVVAPGALARVAPPLRLREVIPSAPAAWRARLSALDAEARAAGLALGVYGSLAWQHLSGEAYVTATSDVDLLVAPHDAATLRSTLGLLRAHAADRAPPLDGELLLAGGRAVAWREVLSGAGRLLVKAGAAVRLEPARAALGALADCPGSP